MAPFTFTVNGAERTVDVPPDMPLLWVLRDELGLTGTKYSCGVNACGACTVDVEGTPTRACVTPVAAVSGRAVGTVEGLSDACDHPLQRAFLEEQVAQCGYCQPGVLMAARALLERNPDPSDGDVDRALAGNLCRCGTYPRIRKAIRRAAEEVRNGRR